MVLNLCGFGFFKPTLMVHGAQEHLHVKVPREQSGPLGGLDTACMRKQTLRSCRGSHEYQVLHGNSVKPLATIMESQMATQGTENCHVDINWCSWEVKILFVKMTPFWTIKSSEFWHQVDVKWCQNDSSSHKMHQLTNSLCIIYIAVSKGGLKNLTGHNLTWQPIYWLVRTTTRNKTNSNIK